MHAWAKETSLVGESAGKESKYEKKDKRPKLGTSGSATFSIIDSTPVKLVSLLQTIIHTLAWRGPGKTKTPSS
jgi:hypothetical protein